MKLRADRREDRRREAEERNQAWRNLTPRQQVASLDRRLGNDNGAKRQRLKLVKPCIQEAKVKA